MDTLLVVEDEPSLRDLLRRKVDFTEPRLIHTVRSVGPAARAARLRQRRR